MCFSATASYSLSGVLGVIGAASITRATSPSTRLFAAIPLLFGLQQFAEGTVWATMDLPAHAAIHRMAIMAFLSLALVVWPLWAPLSLWFLEPSNMRRRVLIIFFSLGAVIAVVGGSLLMRWQPIAVVAGRSIDYQHAEMGIRIPEFVLLLAYAIPTVASFFVSTRPMVRTIGITLAISLVIAFTIQREALTSVWCFFAAVLSGMILVAVTRIDHSPSVLAPALVPQP
jgi:hypothetical protein